MRNNSGLFVMIYVLIIFFMAFAPLFDFIDFDSLNPWDYARITDVDYTAKVIDEPGKRWSN